MRRFAPPCTAAIRHGCDSVYHQKQMSQKRPPVSEIENAVLESLDDQQLDKLEQQDQTTQPIPTRSVTLPTRSLMRDHQRAKAAGAQMASLTIEELPRDRQAALHFFDTRPISVVNKSVFIIGRVAEVCDLAMPDDDQVSRQHAALLYSGGQFYLEDLQSTNGTFVGSERISRTPLAPDQPFYIGAATLVLRWTDSATTATTIKTPGD